MTETTIEIDGYSSQLPLADIVHQMGITVWDGGPPQPEERRSSIDGMVTGDRMMLAIRLASEAGLPPTCSIVAAALAHRGWVSWPSIESIGRAIGVARPNVSRALGQLADSGLIRRQTLRRGQRRAATLIVWDGINLIRSWYQIDTSWEPEEEPGLEPEVIDQSLPVPSRDPVPSWYQSDTIPPEDSSYQSDTIPGSDIPPRWWLAFARRWTPAPTWAAISQHMALGGWSETDVYEAASRMTRQYMGQRVSDPDQLLRTICQSVREGRR